jgi:hypothetical protein
LKKREQALGADLLWLLHQGHVLDFAMGNLQAATRPAPKQTPQPSKKDEAVAEAAEGEVVAVTEELNPVAEAASPVEPAAEAAPTSEEPAKE